MLRFGALIRWPDHDDLEPAQWSTLSILLTVYREPSVIKDPAAAIRALDYPSLEIVLLVEEGGFSMARLAARQCMCTHA